MALTKLQLTGMVNALFTDTMFKTAPEDFFDYALERLNRDRSHVNVLDHTVVSGDISASGTVISLPTDFDIARDKILAVEDLNDDGTSPAGQIYLDEDSYYLYVASSSSVQLRFNSQYSVGQIFRISYRSSYAFLDGSSNIPTSLSRPLAYITAYYLVKTVMGKMALDKKSGGDEIAVVGRISAMKDIQDGFLQEYITLTKELMQHPSGIVPRTNISQPKSTFSVGR